MRIVSVPSHSTLFVRLLGLTQTVNTPPHRPIALICTHSRRRRGCCCCCLPLSADRSHLFFLLSVFFLGSTRRKQNIRNICVDRVSVWEIYRISFIIGFWLARSLSHSLRLCRRTDYYYVKWWHGLFWRANVIHDETAEEKKKKNLRKKQKIETKSHCVEKSKRTHAVFVRCAQQHVVCARETTMADTMDWSI